MINLKELVSAAELAQKEDPDLHIFIYTYKDKAVNRYAPIFANDKEPKFMVDGLKASVLKGGENIKQLTGLQLYFCGTFELKSGLFQICDSPELLLDCDSLIEKIGGAFNVDHKA